MPEPRSRLDIVDRSRLARLHFETTQAAIEMAGPRSTESEIEAYHRAERAFERALEALGEVTTNQE